MESRDAYFDEVYREHAAKLKRFLVVRIRSVSDMEDIFQEAWKRFYERTAVLRPQEPFCYLVKIAKGELSKRYRNQSRRNEREEPLLETIPDEQSPFEPALLDRMDAAQIWSIVKEEPLRDGAVYTEIVYDSSKPNGHSTAFQTDPQYDVMSQYVLTINLDDYR